MRFIEPRYRVAVFIVAMIWYCYCLQYYWFNEDYFIDGHFRRHGRQPDYKIAYRYSTLQRSNKEPPFIEDVANFSYEVHSNILGNVTSGKMSTFELNDSKRAYKIGDQLSITIQARDCRGNRKSTGGDYLRARMYSNLKRASVNPDRIIDRADGTYDVFFTARWSGRSNITVMLVHPAEAVAVIKKVISHFPNRLVYSGLFIDPMDNASRREQSKCDVIVPNSQGAICNYSDSKYDAPLYCMKPSGLECENLRKITQNNRQARERMGRFLTDNEKAVMARIKEPLNATISLDIIDSQSEEKHTEDLPFCKLGQLPLDINAHGFFVDERWRPFSCLIKHFDSEASLRCLANRSLFIFSDSTGWQLMKYLETHLRGFTRVLDENRSLGPHKIYNEGFNVTLFHQFHGFPVGLGLYNPKDEPFVFNAIDKLNGGHDVVILVSLWAHFKKTSLALYGKRILAILDAIRRLLQRSPETTVIFKGANTRELPDDGDFFWPICSSDWVSYQFEVEMRRLILESKLRVGFIDAWDLTNAHHSEDNVHPSSVIIGIMIDQILTHMCAL